MKQDSLKNVFGRLPVTKSELDEYNKELQKIRDEFINHYTSFISDSEDIHEYAERIKDQAITIESIIESNDLLKKYVDTLVRTRCEALKNEISLLQQKCKTLENNYNILERRVRSYVKNE